MYGIIKYKNWVLIAEFSKDEKGYVVENSGFLIDDGRIPRAINQRKAVVAGDFTEINTAEYILLANAMTRCINESRNVFDMLKIVIGNHREKGE